MSTPSVTMPTRIYSSGVFIHSLLSLLQALTALGEADERHKRYNSHQHDNYIKHVAPPRWVEGSQNPQHLPPHNVRGHFRAVQLRQPGAAAHPWETVWAGRPMGEILPADAGSHELPRAPLPAVCLHPPHEGVDIPPAVQHAAHPSLSDLAC